MTPIPLYDPALGTVVTQYNPDSRESVLSRFAIARYGAENWGTLSPAVRSARMFEWVDRMRKDKARLSLFNQTYRGITIGQSLRELESAFDVLSFYAGVARTMTGPVAGEYLRGYRSSVSVRPLGVIGVILPWNYPSLMMAWRLGPILAAGSVAVVKPAEQTPGAPFLHGAEDTLGSGVVQVIRGGADIGEYLTEAGLDGYAFTGSRQTGIMVQQKCAPAPVALELGGNCPAIMLDDAPGMSAERLVEAAFHNAGQSCAAPSRVITTSERLANMIMESVDRYEKAVPVISLEAVTRTVGRQLDTSSDLIRVVTSADAMPDEGFWVRPAAYQITPGAGVELRTKETFAPVITVELVDSTDDAIDLALDSECGNDLAASLWTSNLSLEHLVGEKLSRYVGEVWINCHLVQTPELPHSGGAGLDLSSEAVMQYARPTTTTVRMEL